MDATDLIRQAQSSVERARQSSSNPGRSCKGDKTSSKDSFTLTACCRCRQRKTRCDPGLPRCLPCQRSGATCEYFDRSRGRKMPRSYLLDLQEKVWTLEKRLSQLLDDENSSPNTEDMVRPGGFVRLNSEDELSRYLGPSSGVTMTRLVMEEARKYTDSRSIRELVPDIHDRHNSTSKSTVISKKSYPRISALPAQTLPSLTVAQKLTEVFNKKAQYFTPTLHEPSFAKDMQDVYNGSINPYQNFVLRMVLAISLQKLDSVYSGLADSYYVAAIEFLEEVIRPKDLKTLQCLVLVAQYSLLTPTQTAIYYVIGLATRICQQLGLTEEKTITQVVSLGEVDPVQLDLRRRLAWIILSMEYGLAHTMGRPNSFAPGQDHIPIKFFEPKNDKYITKQGILPAPISEEKTVAIHFLRMRLLQAEIRRKLYQLKRPEPENEAHPWYAEIQQKLKNWVEASPHCPSWSRPWFYGRYLTMIVMIFRPSPQVPQPTTQSAIICYNAAAANINSIDAQMKTAMVDITWVFVLTIFQALNTILWTTSYPEVRTLHPKRELEMYVETALSTISRCQDRWPGTGAAAQLYTKLSQACLRSYDVGNTTSSPALDRKDEEILSIESPSVLITDSNSTARSHHSNNSASSFDISSEQLNSCLADQYFDVRSNKSHITEPRGPLFETVEPCFKSSLTYETPSIRAECQHGNLHAEERQHLASSNLYPSYSEVQSESPEINYQSTVDTSYSINLMNPISYSVSDNTYQNQGFDTISCPRSFRQMQQYELIANLESNALVEIEKPMNPSPGY